MVAAPVSHKKRRAVDQPVYESRFSKIKTTYFFFIKPYWMYVGGAWLTQGGPGGSALQANKCGHPVYESSSEQSNRFL